MEDGGSASGSFSSPQEEIISVRASRHAVVPKDNDEALSRAVGHLAEVAENTHAHLSSIRAKEVGALDNAQLHRAGASVTAFDSNAIFVSVKASNQGLLGSTAVYGVRGRWRRGRRRRRGR